MVKIIVSADCGNSPKNLLLRDFNIAVAKGNLSFVEQNIADTHNLIIVPLEVVIDTVITHGDAGAVNAIKAKGGKSYVFCDIYRFGSHAKGAKIKEMTSYIIETNKSGEVINEKTKIYK